MFTNVGAKLKLGAWVVLGVGCIASIVLGILCFVTAGQLNQTFSSFDMIIGGYGGGSRPGTGLVFIGIFIILFGTVLSYVCALLVHGFAQILKNTQKLADEGAAEAPTSIAQEFTEAFKNAKPQVQPQPQMQNQAPYYPQTGERPAAPAQNAPFYGTPVPAAPAENVQAQAAPVYGTPVNTAPVQEAPAQEAPVPAQEITPAEAKAPVQEIPVETAETEAPVQEAPAEEAPAQAPESEIPAEEPAEESKPAAPAEKQMKYCGMCGAPNDSANAFCQKCGNKFVR